MCMYYFIFKMRVNEHFQMYLYIKKEKSVLPYFNETFSKHNFDAPQVKDIY